MMSFYDGRNSNLVTPRRAFIEQAALRFADSAIARADAPQSVLAPRLTMDDIVLGAAQAAEKLWEAVDQLEWDRRLSPRLIQQIQTMQQLPMPMAPVQSSMPAPVGPYSYANSALEGVEPSYPKAAPVDKAANTLGYSGDRPYPCATAVQGPACTSPVQCAVPTLPAAPAATLRAAAALPEPAHAI